MISRTAHFLATHQTLNWCRPVPPDLIFAYLSTSRPAKKCVWDPLVDRATVRLHPIFVLRRIPGDQNDREHRPKQLEGAVWPQNELRVPVRLGHFLIHPADPPGIHQALLRGFGDPRQEVEAPPGTRQGPTRIAQERIAPAFAGIDVQVSTGICGSGI